MSQDSRKNSTSTTTGSCAGAGEAGAGQSRLGVFVGTWQTEGQQHAGAVGPAAKISAKESYEWLSGERFLVHRFDGRVGDHDASCIEILGFDAESGRYPVHTFYNNGATHEWTYREHEGAWILTGEWPQGEGSMHVRCTVRFGADGDTMTGKWEHSSDGASWKTFWDVRGTRTRQQASR